MDLLYVLDYRFYRSADGRTHTVWFENAYSALAKLGLAHSMNVGSAYLWLAGDEDDLLWKRLNPTDIDRAGRSDAAQPTPISS